MKNHRDRKKHVHDPEVHSMEATVASLRAEIARLSRQADQIATLFDAIKHGVDKHFNSEPSRQAGEVERLRKALGFGGRSDAYYNLGGAIEDIARTGKCDVVSMKTLRRVEAQLGQARPLAMGRG